MRKRIFNFSKKHHRGLHHGSTVLGGNKQGVRFRQNNLCMLIATRWPLTDVSRLSRPWSSCRQRRGDRSVAADFWQLLRSAGGSPVRLAFYPVPSKHSRKVMKSPTAALAVLISAHAYCKVELCSFQQKFATAIQHTAAKDGRMAQPIQRMHQIPRRACRILKSR